MTPKDAAKEIAQRARELKKAADKAQKQGAKAAVDSAKSFSRGTYSQAQLNQMGNPYAKRNPRPPLPPGILNYGSGRVYRGWRRRYELRGRLHVACVWNAAPEAVFLDPKLQTSRNKAIGRPIAALVAASLRSYYPLNTRRRIREALKL